MYRRICKIALFTLARFIVISVELIARLTYFSLQMTYFPSRKCGQFGISERKKNLSLYLCHFILSTTAIVQYFDFKYEWVFGGSQTLTFFFIIYISCFYSNLTDKINGVGLFSDILCKHDLKASQVNMLQCQVTENATYLRFYFNWMFMSYGKRLRFFSRYMYISFIILHWIHLSFLCLRKINQMTRISYRCKDYII